VRSPGRRRGRCTAPGVASGLETELAGGRAIEEPGREGAVLDDGAARARDTFGVEGLRAQPAPPQRIVDDGDAGRKQAFAQLVAQEARLARDRAAIDRGGEVADERARHA